MSRGPPPSPRRSSCCVLVTRPRVRQSRMGRCIHRKGHGSSRPRAGRTPWPGSGRVRVGPGAVEDGEHAQLPPRIIRAWPRRAAGVWPGTRFAEACAVRPGPFTPAQARRCGLVAQPPCRCRPVGHVIIASTPLAARGCAVVPLAVALVLAGCGSGARAPGAADGAAQTAGLLDRAPSTAGYGAVADVAAMRTALEVDRDDLRTGEPPPLVDADGQFDPVARALGVLRSSAVPALLSPLTATFTHPDSGAIDAAVDAFEIGDSSSAALSVTSQPVADAEQGLERDGFAAQGSGRWVFPGMNAPGSADSDERGPSDDPTGGFPAVLVEPGLFVMASSTTALDAIPGRHSRTAGVRHPAGHRTLRPLLTTPRRRPPMRRPRTAARSRNVDLPAAPSTEVARSGSSRGRGSPRTSWRREGLTGAGVQHPRLLAANRALRHSWMATAKEKPRVGRTEPREAAARRAPSTRPREPVALAPRPTRHRHPCRHAGGLRCRCDHLPHRRVIAASPEVLVHGTSGAPSTRLVHAPSHTVLRAAPPST